MGKGLSLCQSRLPFCPASGTLSACRTLPALIQPSFTLSSNIYIRDNLDPYTVEKDTKINDALVEGGHRKRKSLYNVEFGSLSGSKPVQPVVIVIDSSDEEADPEEPPPEPGMLPLQRITETANLNDPY